MEKKNQAKLVVMLAVIGMSMSVVFVRWADAPSVVLAAWRMAFTTIFLIPVILKNHVTELKNLCKKEWILCCCSGIFLGIHLFAYFEAVKYTTVASGMILVNTKVLFVPIALLVLFHEKIPKMAWMAIFLAFVGTVIIALGDRSGGSNIIYGDSMAMVGAIGISVYTLLGRTVRKTVSNTAYTFLVYFSAALTLGIASVIQGISLTGWQTKDYLSAVGMAVFCTLLGHSLNNWALKYLSAAFISVCNLGEPIIATVFSIFAYGEIPTVYQLAGSAIVLGSICLYTFFADVQVKESSAVE